VEGHGFSRADTMAPLTPRRCGATACKRVDLRPELPHPSKTRLGGTPAESANH